MGVRKILGVILIAAGVLVLVYRGFSYTTKMRKVDIGVAELKFAEKERVEIPTWAGVAAVVVGAGLLALGRK